jgi:hypothetical protein
MSNFFDDFDNEREIDPRTTPVRRRHRVRGNRSAARRRAAEMSRRGLV